MGLGPPVRLGPNRPTLSGRSSVWPSIGAPGPDAGWAQGPAPACAQASVFLGPSGPQGPSVCQSVHLSVCLASGVSRPLSRPQGPSLPRESEFRRANLNGERIQMESKFKRRANLGERIYSRRANLISIKEICSPNILGVVQIFSPHIWGGGPNLLSAYLGGGPNLLSAYLGDGPNLLSAYLFLLSRCLAQPRTAQLLTPVWHF